MSHRLQARGPWGDGVIDTFEDCEPGNLGGWTCDDLVYTGGTGRRDAEYCELDDARSHEGDF